jgi:hypothetical protein
MTNKPVRKRGLAAKALRAQLQKQGRGPTLLEHAVIKVGVIQGGEALWNLIMWTMARRKYGAEEPTWQQFGEVAFVQRSMAYKALALLEKVYGEYLGDAADAVEAGCGKHLDTLLDIQSGKDVRVALAVAGPVLAPAGLAP